MMKPCFSMLIFAAILKTKNKKSSRNETEAIKFIVLYRIYSIFTPAEASLIFKIESPTFSQEEIILLK